MGRTRTSFAARALQQLGVVVGARLPFAAPDQGEQAGGVTRAGTAAPVRSIVLLVAHGRGTYTLPGGMYLADAIESRFGLEHPDRALLHVHRSGEGRSGALEELDDRPR